MSRTYDESNRSKRYGRGETAAKVSLGAMVFLTIIKGTTGIAYNSVALLADAVNSLSDVLASALIWAGLRIAGRPANERFPYGYFKGETLASFLVSLMIVVSGIEIVLESISRLLSPTPISNAVLPLLAAAVSITTYFILSKYKLRVGKAIGSQSLIADSTHSIVDVYAGLLVFVGVALSLQGLIFVEIGVAIILGVYIIIQGGVLAKNASLALMDVGADPEVVEKVREIANEIDEVLNVHSIRFRHAGPICFGEMHLTVRSGISIEEAHELTEVIEQQLKEALPSLEAVTIHTEPEETAKRRIAIPIKSPKGLESEIEGHFSRAPLFYIVDMEGNRIKDEQILENPAITAEKKKGLLVADALVKHRVNAVVVGNIGEGPFGILHARHVTIYACPDECRTIQDILAAFSQNQLQRAQPPDMQQASHGANTKE